MDMNDEQQELLGAFGKLFQQKMFVYYAMRSSIDYEDINARGNRGQARLLTMLRRGDGLTNSEIAEKLDIRPSSVSVLVKKLENQGFIKRQDDEEDKRVSRIYLTEEGNAFLDDGKSFKDDVSDMLFSSLSDEEQKQLYDLLSKLNDDLEDKFSDPEHSDDLRRMFEQAQQFGRGFGNKHRGDPRNPFGNFRGWGHS